MEKEYPIYYCKHKITKHQFYKNCTKPKDKEPQNNLETKIDLSK